MKPMFLSLALLLAFFAPPINALADTSQERPKVGLALSGGGARGAAHVGVIQVLEELGVPIDYIAGTSMGAIVGGLYASGYDAAELKQIVEEMDWSHAMTDRPDRVHRSMRNKELESNFLIPHRVGFNGGRLQLPLGVIEGQHLDQVFHRLLKPVIGIEDFDDLPVPFRAIATDLVTGDQVILANGSLSNALRASMSVPGVFAPVTIDDRLLVDGGMANNLPVDVVRDMGADIVIAVDISSPLFKREQLTSVLSVTEQLSGFLTRRTTNRQIELLGPDDILLVPELTEFRSSDFGESVAIVSRGYEAADRAREQLARLSVNGSALPRHGPPQQSGEFIVNFIEINNESVLSDRLIRSRLNVQLGEPIDIPALERSVDRVFSLDVFSSVTYDFIENEEGESGIVIHAQPRSWGPNYMQFGLELSSDFSGTSDFTLGAAYKRNAMNPLGGELQLIGSIGRVDELAVDFYQPVDTAAKWYVRPEAHWTRESYRLWEGDVNVARLGIQGWGSSLSLGRNFDSTSRLQLGYRFGQVDVSLLTGAPSFTPRDVDIGELRLDYLYDTADSIWFPSSGAVHAFQYLYADESLGASDDYDQAMANGSMAFSMGRNTASLAYEIGYSFDDAASIERWYRLGGLGRLSGLAPDQLLGRHVALTTLTLYRRLNQSGILPTYAGMTLEAGNTWEYSDDIGLDSLRYSTSLFVGAVSPLGPLYFAAGYADSGDFSLYFYLGNPFRVSRFK